MHDPLEPPAPVAATPLLHRAALFAVAALTFAPALANQFVNMDDGRVLLRLTFLRTISLRTLWTCVWPFPVREEFLRSAT